MNRDVARLIGLYCDAESLVAWAQVCNACRRGLGDEWEGWGRAAADLAEQHPRANEVLFAGMQRLRRGVVRGGKNNKRYCVAAVTILRQRQRLKASVPINSEAVRVGVMGEGRQRLCALFDGCTWAQLPTLFDAREYMVVDASGRLSQQVVLRDSISSAGYHCSEEWRLRVEGIAPAQHVFVALVGANVCSQKHVAERIAEVRAKCPDTQFLICGVDDFEPAAADWPGCVLGPSWVREEHATAVALLMRALELATTEETRTKCVVM